MKAFLFTVLVLLSSIVSAADEVHWSSKYFQTVPSSDVSYISTSTIREIASSSDTFAGCKAADVITTGYGLSTGRFFEKNPLIAPLVSQGIWPLALISLGVWYVADKYGTPNTNLALNVVTCPVAVHNLWLLLVR